MPEKKFPKGLPKKSNESSKPKPSSKPLLAPLPVMTPLIPPKVALMMLAKAPDPRAPPRTDPTIARGIPMDPRVIRAASSPFSDLPIEQ